jgi:Bacterial archaeo-eukaryotic release factor family 3
MLSVVPSPANLVAPEAGSVHPSVAGIRSSAILRDLGPADLKPLQAVEGYPCISVLLRTAPDLPIGADVHARLAALLATVDDRLQLEMTAAEAAVHVASFEPLLQCLAGQRSGEGLALFVGPGGRAVFRLPLPVDDRVVIDPTFATRDLARTLSLHPAYRVVVMGQSTARLYVGFGARLREVSNSEFPLDTRAAAAAQDTRGHRLTAERPSRESHAVSTFVRRVATALAGHAESTSFPLIVIATTAVAGAVRKEPLLDPADIVIGNHERASTIRLAQLTRPGVDSVVLERRRHALVRLDRASSHRRSALGIHHVWTLARRQEIETLLVDEDFRYPAWTTVGGLTLVRAFTTETPDVLDDAVDEIIEMVQRVDGEVVFLPAGELGPDGIAAIRRRR